MPKKKKRLGARVNVGRDVNGDIIYKWAYAYSKTDLKAEKERVLAEYQAQPAQELAPVAAKPQLPPITPPESNTPIFRAYAWEWYELYKEPVGEKATHDMYRNVLKNHLLPEFGDVPISDITRQDLQRFIIQYDEMSKSLIGKIVMTMRQIFRLAVDDELIAKDPTRKLVPPPGTVGERKPLTLEEVSALVKSAEGNRDGLLPMVLLYTGMRRGEALGLRWEDISDGQIHIRRAAKFDNNTTYIGDTKSKAARRIIPVDERLAVWLSKPKTGYVFGGDTLWTKQKYRKTWERMRESMPVLENVSAHVLRHTYTMLLRRAGVDSATAQYLLGHEDYQTTANVYTHIDALDTLEAKGKMASLLSELLSHG